MQLQGNINIDNVSECGGENCKWKTLFGCLKLSFKESLKLNDLQTQRIKDDGKTIEYLREEVKYWMKQSGKKL